MVALEIAEYVPGGQSKAAVEPAFDVYDPAVHARHAVIVPPGDHNPALHIEHVLQVFAAYPPAQVGIGLQHALAI